MAVATGMLVALPLRVPADEPTRISGVVVDVEGNPLYGAKVSIESSRGPNLWVTTDRNGFFVVLGVGNGELRLLAEKSGLNSCAIDVRLNSGESAVARVS